MSELDGKYVKGVRAVLEQVSGGKDKSGNYVVALSLKERESGMIIQFILDRENAVMTQKTLKVINEKLKIIENKEQGESQWN
jgi:hypothetical protein